MSNLLWFRDISMSDLPRVGGKNASLGEMVSRIHGVGVRVPGGFATTADAYRDFLAQGDLAARIHAVLSDLDTSDVRRLSLVAAGIRSWIEGQEFPAGLEADIRTAYQALLAEQAHPDQVTWAVRSSATAEDLPDASFAGQQETFLNIAGIDNLFEAIRGVFASLYTDRAVVYRAQRGFDEDDIAISAGVQLMVRSDIEMSRNQSRLDMTYVSCRQGRMNGRILARSIDRRSTATSSQIHPLDGATRMPGRRSRGFSDIGAGRRLAAGSARRDPEFTAVELPGPKDDRWSSPTVHPPPMTAAPS